MSTATEPTFMLMQSLHDGRAWLEVFDAPEGYDPRPVIIAMAARTRDEATAMRVRGTSPAARRKARLLDEAALYDQAATDPDFADRLSRSYSGKVLVIRLGAPARDGGT